MTNQEKAELRLIILRGLPGAGKSHFLSKKLPITAFVCSADDFFWDDGDYKFDASKLGQAHMECQLRALNAMADNKSIVVIDNTNSQHWEFAIYLRMGEIFGYRTQVVTIGGRTPELIEEYHARNIHNVPKEIIERMAERWED